MTGAGGTGAGGLPTTSRIPLAVPCLGGNEGAYVARCIEDNEVSSVGGFVEQFERAFALAVGARHAVACASGTAALHVALRLAGAGPGRLVACSTFTFIASANAASYTGADLLLVDSEPDTWNLDSERLHDEVARRARAGKRIPDVVEAVHILGHPARMEPLLALRDRFGIRIVEDAAEALGAGWTRGPLAGHRVGTAGDLGCFSFNGNKTITTGGGGMIVTDDADLAARARHLTTQARLPGPDYEHDEVGYNYRLSNVAAALGLAQLEQLPGFLEAKRRIAQRYREGLAGLPVTTPPEAAWAQSGAWLSAVLLHADTPGPDRISQSLASDGVETRRLWPPLHHQRPYAREERLGGRMAELLYEWGLALPSSVGLTAADQHRVVAALRAALRLAQWAG